MSQGAVVCSCGVICFICMQLEREHFQQIKDAPRVTLIARSTVDSNREATFLNAVDTTVRIIG